MKNKNADNYVAWNIKEKDFPKNGTVEDKIKFLVGYGVLAPSTHNTQPWIFDVVGNKLTISPNTNRKLSVGDPNSWGLNISIGACAENIVQAATVFGFKSFVKHQTESSIISFEEGHEKDKYSLNNLLNRSSDKLLYQSKPIPKDIVGKLKELDSSDIKVQIISDTEIKDIITANHLDAAKKVAKNPKFALELSDWLRPNNSKEFDGMPGFVIGNTQAKSVIGIKVLKKRPQLLQKLVSKDKELLDSSAAIAVFTAKDTSAVSIKNAGGAIERFWLKATEEGLVAHPLFASIQDVKAREKLKLLLETELTPVFLMRLGYSNNDKPHTPRAGTMSKSAIKRLAETLKSHPTSHKVKVGKYEINYVTAGQGEPLLLIHGANIGWPQWHLNLDELAKNFKVYALDLPGAGDSTKVNFRKTEFVKDYLNIVDEFVKKVGLKNINLVGSSFGGWVAMKLAIENKPYIKHLVLTNPIGFTRHMPAKFRPISIWPLAKFMSKTALRPARNNKNLEKFMRDVFYEKNQPLANEFIDYFYELSETSHNVLFISRLAHYSGMRKELFLGPELHKIKVKTLVIWGKEDPLMPYAGVRDNFAKIPNVKVEILPKVGHMPPVESPSKFNSLVKKFLKAR